MYAIRSYYGIDKGGIRMFGTVDNVVHEYLDSSASLTSSAILKQESKKPMHLENIRVKNQYMQLDRNNFV